MRHRQARRSHIFPPSPPQCACSPYACSPYICTSSRACPTCRLAIRRLAICMLAIRMLAICMLAIHMQATRPTSSRGEPTIVLIYGQPQRRADARLRLQVRAKARLQSGPGLTVRLTFRVGPTTNAHDELTPAPAVSEEWHTYGPCVYSCMHIRRLQFRRSGGAGTNPLDLVLSLAVTLSLKPGPNPNPSPNPTLT